MSGINIDVVGLVLTGFGAAWVAVVLGAGLRTMVRFFGGDDDDPGI